MIIKDDYKRLFPTFVLEMDPLLPTLRILDPSVPQNRQQCLLKASKEAKTLASHNKCYDRNTVQDEKTACDEGNISLRVFPLHVYTDFLGVVIKVITISVFS